MFNYCGSSRYKVGIFSYKTNICVLTYTIYCSNMLQLIHEGLVYKSLHPKRKFILLIQNVFCLFNLMQYNFNCFRIKLYQSIHFIISCYCYDYKTFSIADWSSWDLPEFVAGHPIPRRSLDESTIIAAPR